MSARLEVSCARCARRVPRRGFDWPEGFVCNRCYQQATRRRGACPVCAEHRLLPGLIGGEPTCADCAGLGKDFHCARCGQEDEPHRKGLCARCCLRDDLTTMLAAPTGQIPTTIRPVTDALIAQDHPRSALIWLRNPDVTRMLRGLADGSMPLTHDSFDAEPERRSAMHLRELFVRYGVLPERDRTLLLFEAWLKRTIPSYSPGTAALLTAFARWHHLRQMRPLADTGQLRPGRAATARQEITVAAQLLTHLESLGVTTDELDQSHLDAWLAAGPTTRYTARTFVIWAVRNRRLPAVNFPHRTGKTRPVLPEDKRLAMLRRCFRDEQWASPGIRLAASLLLLYGQPVSRICRLRLKDIARHRDVVTFDFGDEPAIVPPVMQALLDQHLAQRPNTSTAANADSPWLFPGFRPGQPLTPSTLMTQLRTHGIDLQAARNGALRQLVLDMPHAVAARILGYSPAVTENHARHAATPWQSYPAADRSPELSSRAGSAPVDVCS